MRSSWRLCLVVVLLTYCGGIHSFSPEQGHAQLLSAKEASPVALNVPRGGASIVPAGWNPFGYKVTKLGQEFLGFGDSLLSDVGRFLASLKAHRKRRKAIKEQWLEIVRASKKGQSMRIYRELDNLLDFCLKAGLID